MECFLQIVTNVKESSFYLKVIRSKFIRNDPQRDDLMGNVIFRLEIEFLLKTRFLD